MEEKAKEILLSGAKQLGLELNSHHLKQFDIYLNNLKFFNKKINLTKITEDREIVIKHFLDSLTVLKSGLIKEDQWVADMGAGAGFPGLVLKIIQPKIILYLVESHNKKALFLDIISRKLGLRDVSIITDRVEIFGQGSGRDRFDLVLARALAPLPVLVEYGIPLLKKEAYLIAMKAKLSGEEKQRGEKACGIINCEIEKTVDVEVPFLEAERKLLLIKKTWGTPKQYPRRPGLPNKRPLG